MSRARRQWHRRWWWLVYITPASGVGGEFPEPIPFKQKRKAEEYARECRAKLGQRTRVVPRYRPDIPEEI